MISAIKYIVIVTPNRSPKLIFIFFVFFTVANLNNYFFYLTVLGEGTLCWPVFGLPKRGQAMTNSSFLAFA